MLYVRLLGDFMMHRDKAPIHSELGHSGMLLASYLFAFPDRPHRRERLASLFWPELDEDHSRSALNSAIWRLRKMIGGPKPQAIRSIGPEVVLDQPHWLEIDKQRLETIVKQCIDNHYLLAQPRKQQQLSDALRLHDKHFLASEDGDWILEERERLQSLYIRGSEVLIRRLGLESSYDTAVEIARRALHFDPYREQLVRLYLGMLALADQRVEAVRYFLHWTTLLESELGVSPMPATLALIDLIRSAASQYDFEQISVHVLSTPTFGHHQEWT
jgi:DNA-binding SARP family transcriptional activator